MGFPIELNIDIKGTPVTENIRVDACDPITSAVEASVTLLGPVSFPASAVITVPEAKVYELKVIKETGSGDILLNNYVEDSSKISFSTSPDMEFVVDRSGADPVSGTSSFAVPALDGKAYRLVQRGVGPLVPGLEWDYLAGGGIQLLNGRTFNITGGIGDTYFVEYYPDSTVSPQDLDLVVDRGLTRDPLNGTTQYRNSSLIGKSYRVEQRGLGPKRTDEITIVSAGGFDLLGGEVFSHDDVWFIHFYPTIVLQTPSVSGIGKEYDDIIEITADAVYDSSHQGKLIVARAAGTKIRYSLPLGAALPANKFLAFKNTGLNALMLTIETAGGQDIEITFNGVQVLNDQVWIGSNEIIKLQWKTDRWYVINNWNMDKVGSFQDSYKVLTNSVHANGSTALRDSQPRIWWVINNFYPELLIDETTWNGEKGLYSTGDNVTNFRFPDWTGKTAKAQANTLGVIGYHEDAQVGQFTGAPIPAKAGSHGGASDAEAGTVAVLNNSGTAEVDFVIKGSAVVHNLGKQNRVDDIGILKLIWI